jgi:UDP:flavonoid glycosyltransferase YjiC (YdhE family)
MHAQNTQRPSGRIRILFLCESVTLAHVARPLALALALDPLRFDVHLACDDRYGFLPKDSGCRWHNLKSISSHQFLRALAKGSPVYDAKTLRDYVEADLELISEIQPDVVVGDFRLSLAVSASVAGVPYATITNAYWSPYADPKYTVPDLPFVRILGPTLGQALFDAVRPVAFALHTRPLNRVRREHGLQDLGLSLGATYTYADLTLYADIPEVIPTTDLPANHSYIGPIAWQPGIPFPEWWDRVPADKPVVYLTLGSSGQAEALPGVLESLARLPVTVMAATAGRIRLESPPKNTFVADYLPGNDAAKRADLVICNGGSPTTSQALQAGVPVIGIASNLDQYLNMSFMEQSGVGVTLRGGRKSPAGLARTVDEVLSKDCYRSHARTAMAQLAAYQPTRIFPELVATLL